MKKIVLFALAISSTTVFAFEQSPKGTCTVSYTVESNGNRTNVTDKYESISIETCIKRSTSHVKLEDLTELEIFHDALKGKALRIY